MKVSYGFPFSLQAENALASVIPFTLYLLYFPKQSFTSLPHAFDVICSPFFDPASLQNSLKDSQRSSLSADAILNYLQSQINGQSPIYALHCSLNLFKVIVAFISNNFVLFLSFNSVWYVIIHFYWNFNSDG